MGRYRKIDPRFWKDEKIVALSPEEKLVVLYLFTGQSNRIGIFSFSPGEAAEDVGTLPQTFAERFGKVCRTLNLGWDETFRVLYIPTWWKYNPPENSNNVIGNLKDLDDVPNSPLINQFVDNLEYLPETLRETFTQTLAKRYPKRYPKRSPSQEQEQEQDKEIAATPLHSLPFISLNGGGPKNVPDKQVLKKKPEVSPKPDPRIKPFFAFWKEEFERRFGQSYPFSGDKEGLLIKRLPESYDFEKLKGLAVAFFDLDDSWISQHGGYTIGMFCSQIAKLVSTTARSADHGRRETFA